MSVITSKDVLVPCDVPPQQRELFINNYLRVTRNTGRLMLFAGDQKVEHLNDDFYGTTEFGEIAADDHSPDHLFRIASSSTIGAFATQLGLIGRYGSRYPDVTYIAKLNSKSHLVKLDQHEPLSRALWQVDDVAAMREHSGLNIAGLGYTCYLGSQYESDMLTEAAQIVCAAHRHGLLAIIWMYPRGKAVPNDKDPHLIAGACGVAACLGADFVKVNYPEADKYSAETFREAIQAAGNTGVICAGGKTAAPNAFLQQIYDQIHVSGAAGNATGRNIHQRSFAQAVGLCNAISAVTLGDYDADYAEQVYQGKATFQLVDTPATSMLGDTQ